MVVGVPGTGIGGLFYLFMAVLMPIRELWLAVRGRSSLRAWKFIAIQLSMIGGIVGVMTLMQLALRAGCEAWAAHTDNPALAHNLQLMVKTNTGATAGFATFASITMLCVVVGTVHVLRLFVRPSRAAGAPGMAPTHS